MKLVKIPSNLGAMDKADGVELAPDAVIKEIRDLYLSEEGILPNFDVDEAEVIKKNMSETNDNIFNKASEAFKETNCPIFLGGDHSITLPLIKAFSQSFQNPGIIIFDAHPDAMQDFETHEDLLPGMVNNNLIKRENIVLVGIRNWHRNEIEFLQKNNIKFYRMDEITAEGIHEIADAVMSVAKNWNAVYLSIDIDAVDPAYAPGTGYCEPGGMTSRELLYFIHRLKKLNKIKAVDLVEINPKKDTGNLTAKLGAKILVELC